MDLRRLITTTRVWLPLMVVTCVLAAAAALVVSNYQQKIYEAKATLIVGQALSAANPDYTQILVAQNLSTTYAAIAKTVPILERLIKDLELATSPEELAGRLRIEAPKDSTLLTITAEDTDPARAAALANALAEQLIAVSPAIQSRDDAFQRSIQADLEATQGLIKATQARVQALMELDDRTAEQEAELEALEGRLVSLRSTYATLLSFSSEDANNLLTVIEPAGTPTSPVSPRPLLNALLAAAVGLLVVFGIAFLVEQLDDSIKDPDAVQDVAGLSTLGTIEQMPSHRGRKEVYQLAAILYPHSRAAEAYRALRANVEFASVDAPVRTLLVTSAAPREGKTVTASNLAAVFAQAGRTVLLVDADLRRPGVHTIFRLPNSRGLTTMLRSDSVGVDSVAHQTEQANLRIVTTGQLPPNPAELLGSQRMQAVLELLKREAEIVIFDSPPLQAVTDAAVVSSFVDGTLLIIDATISRRRIVRAARETLARARANAMGVVLNRVAAGAQFGYIPYGAEAALDEERAAPAGAHRVVTERPGTSADVQDPG